jgi:hypothetical protein
MDENGAPDGEALIVRGSQRAGALAVFFGAANGLPAPDSTVAGWRIFNALRTLGIRP